MQITVLRDTFTSQSVTSEVMLDGKPFCFGLEPPNRANKPCCIPAETYEVQLLWSNRFQMTTPHIMNVPNFTEVEIHPGNSPADTEACLLVGSERAPDWVSNSRVTFSRLMELLKVADKIQIQYFGGVSQ